jgi:hypothetical protein
VWKIQWSKLIKDLRDYKWDMENLSKN